ncbi:uncharacterized protein LOC116213839 isoform X1 [Punica granatum]|uniref:Uncharacterized protein LOC116213839 isoform X1 n=1 Tax=Punica granatum TaxID=22663 RepID=A0A218VY33_PUNGR|nr:uncharacterized protein LOC116213839 isoform X1 [Punica granatum]OWM65326.1 hypothetical protein CDL15_Pgr008916 [Punica granatum]
MDHQWRPRPMQGSICPVCCVPHFPFCPSPPSFGQSPSFPLPPGHQRPGFGPYPPHPWRGPSDGVGEARNWHPYPNPGMDAYGQFPIRPHSENFVPVPRTGGGSNGFVGEAERNYKRMRTDSRVATEDERRLKLIREHGGGNSGSGLEVARLGSDDSSPGAELASADKETSRLADTVSGRNVSFVSGEDGFGVETQSSLQVSQKPLSNEYSSGISRDNFVSNFRPQQPYRLPFPGIDVKQSFDGTHDPSDYRYFPGITQYAAPSLKAHSLPLPRMSSSLFPVHVNTSGTPLSYPSAPETIPVQSYHHYNKQLPNAPNGFTHEEYGAAKEDFSMQYIGNTPPHPHPHPHPSQQLPSQKPKVIDASHIFRPPNRAARPDHFVVILRGLPGSGKTYLAKMLRDLEVENGGAAPRIYSMDEYFMTEVEKVEEVDSSKSSGNVRGKRPATRKVMEYCYEPEMEEAYRGSMLKAYSKTVEEGVFTFIIVDDRNLRVADFAQFWAIGKKSGYEVYVLEATYKDPEGCAARNVHGFTLDDIQQMVGKWEEAPALYLQLDVKSLCHGDELKESGIQEVEMDMEDEDDEGPSAIEGKLLEKCNDAPLDDDAPSEDHPKEGEGWEVEGDHSKVVRDLGRSKWSEDPEEHDNEGAADVKDTLSVSSLDQAYSKKKRKSVRWGDKAGDTGFSIIAAKRSNSSSLVIGPGAGYNLKSNPLPKEASTASTHSPIEPKKQRTFQERRKAERESFKAVFDRRRTKLVASSPMKISQ